MLRIEADRPALGQAVFHVGYAVFYNNVPLKITSATVK